MKGGRGWNKKTHVKYIERVAQTRKHSKRSLPHFPFSPSLDVCCCYCSFSRCFDSSSGGFFDRYVSVSLSNLNFLSFSSSLPFFFSLLFSPFITTMSPYPPPKNTTIVVLFKLISFPFPPSLPPSLPPPQIYIPENPAAAAADAAAVVAAVPAE